MSKPPILFLDIDGVLNSIQYAIRTCDNSPHMIVGFDPQAIALLDNIVYSTNCEIVISSSMRRAYSISKLRDKFRMAGMRNAQSIIDVTPIFHGIKSYDLKRGHEVQAWLNALPLRGADRIYCCIDDDTDYLPSQPFVHIDNEWGLTEYDVERIITMLSRK